MPCGSIIISYGFERVQFRQFRLDGVEHAGRTQTDTVNGLTITLACVQSIM
ncbi:MAG TPA: hypothetical protein VF666_13230 [Pyrinomonadaceae bacterium]|jgi:hypothetical protein